jgi:hypothetical protein
MLLIRHIAPTTITGPRDAGASGSLRARPPRDRSAEDAFQSGYVTVTISGVRSRIRADPSVLPARHGRGPTGWPLKLCECPCARPIPWPRESKTSEWLPPRDYNARRFIDASHAAAWKRNLKNTPTERYGHRASIAPRPGVIHSTIESIVECHRCKNQINLRNVGIGKACQCGHITFCQEGDWARESVRASVSV